MLSLAASATLVTAGCGDDTTSADGSTSDTDTGPTATSASTMPTTTMGVTTDVDDTTTTGPDDTTTTGPDTVTSTSSSSTDTEGDESSSSSGGEMPPEGEVVRCDNTIPAAPRGAVCGVTAGDTTMLIRGDVLSGTTVFEDGTVLVDGSGPNAIITCVGCDCADEVEAATATVLDCPEGVVSPGLINPHDHITFSLSQPQDHGMERYDHRHDWRLGLDEHTEINTFPGANSSTEGVLYGELRMLFGAATSVNGSGAAGGLLRNLDRPDDTEGLSGVDVDYRTFPLGDTGGQFQTSGCAYPSIDDSSRLANDIYAPHIAEGINDEANNEFECLSTNAGEDLIEANTAMIHGIGLTAADVGEVADANAKLVWSPRSNVDLYGVTADVLTYHHMGATIALGTDWSASGSMNVLRELQCADNLNTNHYNGAFSDLELWLMSTYWAAVATGAEDQIGLIKEGRIADLAIFDGSNNEHYRAVIDAETTDVALVLRGGEPLYGDANIIGDLVPAGEAGLCETFDMCGASMKSVCAERDSGLSMASIVAAVNPASYDLYPCGEPDNEPSCDPARPMEFPVDGDDSDGDGVADDDDNCRNVFNPIRPMDDGEQADVDRDGRGDACDVCPLDNGQNCDVPDIFDVDGDMVGDFDDNCVADANPMQEDSDMDGAGDACDNCPMVPNPGGTLCPVSIYDIKDGTVAFGENVRVEDATVTGAADGSGFFVQVVDTDMDYAGPDFSGLFVFTNGAVPAAGDRVTVDGNVQDFFGQTQLVALDWFVESNGNPLPDPEPATVADIVEGGLLEEEYEGIVVVLSDLNVTDVAPMAGPGDDGTNEFEVAGGLRVNDFFFLIEPFPMVGTTYGSMSGIARWANDFTKLEPRGIEDLPVSIVSFGEGNHFLEEGAVAGSALPPVVVTLSTVVTADTTVALTYENAAIVTGPASVTVMSGTNSAEVLLDGAGQGTATVSATLDGNTLDTSVRVYGAAETRSVISLTPDPLNVPISTTSSLTVGLDIPAPAGGQVVNVVAAPGTFITVPPTVTVLAGELDASVMVTAGAVVGDEMVTASIGASMVSANVSVADSPVFADLIITEVFYDSPGGDNALEWVKIYNGTGSTVDLSGYSIGWGGTDYTYGTLQLTGNVSDGACWLVGGPMGNTETGFPGMVMFDQAIDFNPDIQNSGGTADGVALFDIAAASVNAGSIPVDAVIYGGANDNGLADETGAGGMLDVADAPSGSSLRRLSDDTFEVNATPTPLECVPFPTP